MPSTPAATHCSTAASACACAVTGEAEPVRLLDDGSDFLRAELAGSDVGVRRHHAAAGHDLHQVGAAVGAFPDRPAQLADAAAFAAHDRAVAAHAGDRRAGGDDRRPVGPVPVPVDHRPLLVTEVPHRRHARGELRRKRRLDGLVELVRAQAGQSVQRVGFVVAAQMAVGVDEAGQQSGARQVGHLAAIRGRRGRRLPPR